MKTAEIRGIMRQYGGGVVTPTTYLCSWFESRYPSFSKTPAERGFFVYAGVAAAVADRQPRVAVPER